MATLRQNLRNHRLYSSLYASNAIRACTTHKQRAKNERDVSSSSMDEARYPKIKPKFPPGKWGDMHRKTAWLWQSERRQVCKKKTVMGKLYTLIDGKYRTWKYEPVARVPNLFDYQCDKTKTFPVVEKQGSFQKHSALPNVYKEFTLDESIVDDCEKLLKNYISTFDYVNRSKAERKMKDKLFSTPMQTRANVLRDYNSSHLQTKELIMTLISYLSGHYDDIRNCTLDEDVRVACTWHRHGVDRMTNYMRDPTKMSLKLPEDYIHQKNSAFQADHRVDFQIRKDKPLTSFIETSDPLIDTVSYPTYSFKPSVCGQFSRSMRRGIEAGFNVGDPNEFVHLSMVMLNEKNLIKMLKYGEKSHDEDGNESYDDDALKCYNDALFGYALSTGFVAAMATAHYQGFNMYQNLRYPITSQTILTDGYQFMFSAYQLNTLELWKDDVAVPLHNVCWVSHPQDLFTLTEEKGENRIKIDRATLVTLLKFLLCPFAKVKKTKPNVKAKYLLSENTIPDPGKKPKQLADLYLRGSYLDDGFRIKPRPPQY